MRRTIRPMRNITLRLPRDLIRRVKVAAARQDKSLNQMIAELLELSLSEPFTAENERAFEHHAQAMAKEIARNLAESTATIEKTLKRIENLRRQAA